MPDLTPVYTELRRVMAPYAGRLDVKQDDAAALYLDTHHLQKNKKPLFFGAVQVKKSYVAYHLMPVYTDPALLDSISAELRARMQGKSCFNFKQPEPALFEELAALTARAVASYEAAGYLEETPA